MIVVRKYLVAAELIIFFSIPFWNFWTCNIPSLFDKKKEQKNIVSSLRRWVHSLRIFYLFPSPPASCIQMDSRTPKALTYCSIKCTHCRAYAIISLRILLCACICVWYCSCLDMSLLEFLDQHCLLTISMDLIYQGPGSKPIFRGSPFSAWEVN